eukprot:jgi/Chlat1/1873/Chrsp141S02182
MASRGTAAPLLVLAVACLCLCGAHASTNGGNVAGFPQSLGSAAGQPSTASGALAPPLKTYKPPSSDKAVRQLGLGVATQSIDGVEYVLIDATAKPGQAEALVEQLKALNAVSVSVAGDYRWPPKVQSQGDKAMRADALKAMVPGLTGAGVKVGVLSDSYNALGGAAKDVASGDLPAGVVVLKDITKGTDEGRAMLQLVHDVAPGSPLYFYTAHNGLADFANGIKALAQNGCKVIVDDVSYFAEPYFEDGILAQAVDQVKAAGSAYFSSAQNQAREAWETGKCYFHMLGLSHMCLETALTVISFTPCAQ